MLWEAPSDLHSILKLLHYTHYTLSKNLKPKEFLWSSDQFILIISQTCLDISLHCSSLLILLPSHLRILHCWFCRSSGEIPLITSGGYASQSQDSSQSLSLTRAIGQISVASAERSRTRGLTIKTCLSTDAANVCLLGVRGHVSWQELDKTFAEIKRCSHTPLSFLSSHTTSVLRIV